MTDGSASAVIEQYLVDLYGSTPHGLLWIGGHADGWKGRTFRTPGEAAGYAAELDVRGGMGVYHRSTTLKRVPERRGEAEDSSHVYYFALDADIKGEGHKADNLPESREDIERLIETAGMPAPTVWVFSGGGWYPQWRFPEPVDVREAEVLAWVTEVFAMVSAHFIETAKGLGWRLDNVRDLARVFRVPGTTNRKIEGAEVSARVEAGTGELVDLGVLAGRARPRRTEPSTAAPAGESGPGDLFEDAVRGDGRRRFTEEQALEFVAAAYGRLKEALGPGSFNTPITTFAKVCSHFPWLVDRERCAKNVDNALKKHGRSVTDKDYRLAIDSAYTSTEKGGDPAADWVAEKVETPGPDENMLPAPWLPVDTARVLVDRRTGPRLAWWEGQFYQHNGMQYVPLKTPAVRQWVMQETEHAYYMKETKDGDKPARWAPNTTKVNHVVDALAHLVVHRAEGPAAGIDFRNGYRDSLTGELIERTPDRFNVRCLDFDYLPDAGCPMWLDFLRSIELDEKGMAFLQEFMGYVLSGRTDLEKMAIFKGPRRSGKGTIGTVLGAMVGEENVTGPTIRRLGGEFGPSVLIDKSLAIMADVKWTKATLAAIQEDLLSYTGRDRVTINRKGLPLWEGFPTVRFIAMSNHVPVFDDSSSALGGRFVYLVLHKSFWGMEDPTLKGRLLTELPGIYNWAMDGLARLNSQGGQFTQSDSAQTLRDEIDRDANPCGAFYEDCWVKDDAAPELNLQAIYVSFLNWDKESNRRKDEHMVSWPRFSRDFRNAVEPDGVRVELRKPHRGGREYIVHGLQWRAGCLIDQPGEGSGIEDPI